MLRGRCPLWRPSCGGCVKRRGAWRLVGLLVFVAVVSFFLGYIVMIRFIL